MERLTCMGSTIPKAEGLDPYQSDLIFELSTGQKASKRANTYAFISPLHDSECVVTSYIMLLVL